MSLLPGVADTTTCLPPDRAKDGLAMRFIAIRIMFDLIGLRVRQGNHLISFEMMMCDGLPVGCVYPVVEIYMFVDKDQYTRKSELVAPCYLLY